jgi:hypothetical protein
MADDPCNEPAGGPPPSSPDDSTTPMSPAHGREQVPPKRAALGIGELLANRYKVLRFIGEGGMGEAFPLVAQMAAGLAAAHLAGKESQSRPASP